MIEVIAFFSNVAGRNSIKFLLEIGILSEYLKFLVNHNDLSQDILIEVIYGLGNFAGDEIDVSD